MTQLKLGTALLLAAITGGCIQPDASPVAPTEEDGPAAARARAVQATAEATEAFQDYAWERKQELVERMNGDLTRLGEQLDELSAAVESSGDEAKDDARAELQDVRARWARTRKHVDAAGDSTEASWDQVKGDIRQSSRELQASWSKARLRLSKKIAP